jgi:thiol-disulfide isomerase/thioredoxin
MKRNNFYIFIVLKIIMKFLFFLLCLVTVIWGAEKTSDIFDNDEKNHYQTQVSLENFELPHFQKSDKFNFSSLKGKAVVLDFWASWCQLCLMSLNQLSLWQKNLPNVKIIAVNYDEKNKLKAAHTIKKNKFSFLFLEDPEKLILNYLQATTFVLPQMIILDKNLRIIKVIKGFNSDEKEAQQFLQYLRSL